MPAKNRFSGNRLPAGRNKNAVCPIRDVLASYGDKWSLHAIILLGTRDKLRFNEIRSGIMGISQRMLTVTLRSLEQDGIVLRTLYHELPPRVEYSLTTLGSGLFQQVQLMAQWANANAQQIIENRKNNLAIRVNAERKE